MEHNFKRPKTLHSKTSELLTSCGKLFVTLGFLNEDLTRLCEVRATIGKGGICPSLMLDTISKLLSIIIQSPLSKKKILKKIRKQFISVDKKECLNCGQPFVIGEREYRSCVDLVAQVVVKHLS